MAKKASEFDKKLKEMNQDWEANKDAPPGAPDGTYTMQLQGLQLREAESSGNLYINREHLITEGEHEGVVIYDMLSLGSERGPYYVSKFIDKMGYETPEKATGIPEILAAIEGDAPLYSATIKHSGDFVNVRIGEIISGGGAEEGADPGPTADQVAEATDDTIPIGTKVKFTDTDEGEIEGELVDNTDPADHRVKDANGQEWSLERHELQLIGGADDESDDGDIPGTGEENVDDLIELIALAQACDCEGINADDSLEDVVKKMKDGYTWFKSDLDSNERLLLERHGIKPE